MTRRILGIIAVWVAVAAAWMILGSSVTIRTVGTGQRLEREVSALWGSAQQQVAPTLTFRWPEQLEEKHVENPGTPDAKVVLREKTVWREERRILDGSNLDVGLSLDQRRKGLLWYSTYAVDFDARYEYVHKDDREGLLIITYRFPAADPTYDEFRFEVEGAPDAHPTPVAEDNVRVVQQTVNVRPDQRVPFRIAYRSRGLDRWYYSFGSQVNQVRNFRLAMRTNFGAIDFPAGTISPDRMEREGDGWQLTWESENLISGFQIGMEMPHRINPGPLASRIAYFAPVSLGFFFSWIFVITLLRGISLHPINYLFLAAAFFAFHLLFAYTVDHIDLRVAFLLSSAVSIGLVVSYLRLVAGLRFAAVEAGLSQLIYLVLFSYAHFFEGFTGLVVTIGSILTLFALMQLTGRIDWDDKFRPAAALPADGAISEQA